MTKERDNREFSQEERRALGNCEHRERQDELGVRDNKKERETVKEL